MPLLWSQIFAIAVTWLITGLNYLGIKKAGDFQLVFTILKAVLILDRRRALLCVRIRIVEQLRHLAARMPLADSADSCWHWLPRSGLMTAGTT